MIMRGKTWTWPGTTWACRVVFFFSSRRRHTRCSRDWSSDVCSSDLEFLMILMRKSDWFVQTANFYSYVNNSIINDGKVVNVREYLRSLPEFQNMTVGDRKSVV